MNFSNMKYKDFQANADQITYEELKAFVESFLTHRGRHCPDAAANYFAVRYLVQDKVHRDYLKANAYFTADNNPEICYYRFVARYHSAIENATFDKSSCYSLYCDFSAAMQDLEKAQNGGYEVEALGDIYSSVCEKYRELFRENQARLDALKLSSKAPDKQNFSVAWFGKSADADMELEPFAFTGVTTGHFFGKAEFEPVSGKIKNGKSIRVVSYGDLLMTASTLRNDLRRYVNFNELFDLPVAEQINNLTLLTAEKIQYEAPKANYNIAGLSREAGDAQAWENYCIEEGLYNNDNVNRLVNSYIKGLQNILAFEEFVLNQEKVIEF